MKIGGHDIKFSVVDSKGKHIYDQQIQRVGAGVRIDDYEIGIKSHTLGAAANAVLGGHGVIAQALKTSLPIVGDIHKFKIGMQYGSLMQVSNVLNVALSSYDNTRYKMEYRHFGNYEATLSQKANGSMQWSGNGEYHNAGNYGQYIAMANKSFQSARYTVVNGNPTAAGKMTSTSAIARHLGENDKQIAQLKANMLASVQRTPQALQAETVQTARNTMLKDLRRHGLDLGQGTAKDINKVAEDLRKKINGSIIGSQKRKNYEDQLVMLNSFCRDFGVKHYSRMGGKDKVKGIASIFGYDAYRTFNYGMGSVLKGAGRDTIGLIKAPAAITNAAARIAIGHAKLNKQNSQKYDVNGGLVGGKYALEETIAKFRGDANAATRARSKRDNHRHRVEAKARKRDNKEDYKRAKKEAKANGTFKEFKEQEKAARKEKKKSQPGIEKRRRRKLRSRQKKGTLTFEDTLELKVLNAKLFMRTQVNNVKGQFRRVFNPVTKKFTWVSGIYGRISRSRFMQGASRVFGAAFDFGKLAFFSPLAAMRWLVNGLQLIKKKIYMIITGALVLVFKILSFLMIVAVICCIVPFFASEFMDKAKEKLHDLNVRQQLDSLNYCQYIVDKTAEELGEQFLVTVQKDAESNFLSDPIEDIDGNTEFEGRDDIYFPKLDKTGNKKIGHTNHHAWYYLINNGQVGATVSRETVNTGKEHELGGINDNILPITSMMHFRFCDDLDFWHYPMGCAYNYYLYTASHDVRRTDNSLGGSYADEENTPLYNVRVADDCRQLYERVPNDAVKFLMQGGTNRSDDPLYDKSKHIVRGREPGTGVSELGNEDCENLYLHTYKMTWGKKHMEEIQDPVNKVKRTLQYGICNFVKGVWEGNLNKELAKSINYNGSGGKETTEAQLRINGIMLDAANVVCFGATIDDPEDSGSPDDPRHTCSNDDEIGFVEMPYSFEKDNDPPSCGKNPVETITVTGPQPWCISSTIQVIPGIKYSDESKSLTFPQKPEDEGYYDSAVNPERQWDLSISLEHDGGPVPYYHKHTAACRISDGKDDSGRIVCGLAERDPGDIRDDYHLPGESTDPGIDTEDPDFYGGDRFRWLASGGDKASVLSDYRTCFVCCGHCGGHITPSLDCVIDMSFDNLEQLDGFVVRHAKGKELPIAMAEVSYGKLMEVIMESVVWQNVAAWKTTWMRKAQRWFQPFPSNPKAYLELYGKAAVYDNWLAVFMQGLDNWINGTESTGVYGNTSYGGAGWKPTGSGDDDGKKAYIFGIKDYFAFDGWFTKTLKPKYTADLESLYGKYEKYSPNSYKDGRELWEEFDVIFPGGINMGEELSRDEIIEMSAEALGITESRAKQIYNYDYPADIKINEAIVVEALKGVGQYYYVSDSGAAHENAYLRRSGASDCSGFVSGVIYRAVHYGELPKNAGDNPPLWSSAEYMGAGGTIGSLSPGDIVSKKTSDPNAWNFGHVGIYIGNVTMNGVTKAMYVHSTSKGGHGRGNGGSIISDWPPGEPFTASWTPNYTPVKPEKKKNSE